MQKSMCFWVETREHEGQEVQPCMELVIRILELERISGAKVSGESDGVEADVMKVGRLVADVTEAGTEEADTVEILAELSGEDGLRICQRMDVTQGEEMVLSCPGVKLWDPEHPCLYQVHLKAVQKGEVLLEQEAQVGFRTLEKAGKQLLWNHRPLKLKGICYRERPEDKEGTRRDLELFARANVNFIRSIYYPFSPEFLSLCDEMGFLVENTAPFYEIGQSKTATQDLPHCRKDFVEPVQKMLAESGSHVSVLIWSLGHDCAWGSNFRMAAEFIRSVDSVRPLTFHLPMSIPEEEQQMDIWPVHYIDWKQSFDVCFDQMVIFHTPGEENEIGYKTGKADYEVPVLHEIWSPVPCHNRNEIEKDYSIREFWGESISRFAEKSYQTPGCLGGAVLAGVDEDGSFDGMTHYWGILDGAHMPKPEYKHLAKAYAPVRIKSCRLEGGELQLEIENRFLFTDLAECALIINGVECEELSLEGEPGCSREYTLNGNRYSGKGRDAQEASKEDPRGEEMSRADAQKPKEHIEVAVLWQGGEVCREKAAYREKAAAKLESVPADKAESRQELTIAYDEAGSLVVAGAQVRYCFDPDTCLLQSAAIGGKTVLKGGPWLNTTGFLKGRWKGRQLEAAKAEEKVCVTIRGSYLQTLDIRFDLLISPDGGLHTFYEVEKLYRHMPHRVKADVGLSGIGLNEKGITYLLAEDIDCFYSSRQGAEEYWGSEEGFDPQKSNWGSLYQVSSFRGFNRNGSGVELGGEIIPSLRLESVPICPEDAIVDDRDVRMEFAGDWYPVNDYCGNYGGTEMMSRTAGDTMRLHFVGTGVCLYGAVDMNYGMCSVTLDDRPIAEEVSQYPEKVDFPGMSRGYEKRYGQLIAEVHGLEEKEHVLTVTVLGRGKPGAQNTYTSIDYAVLEGSRYPKGTLLHVNQAFNFTRLVRGCYKKPDVYLVEGVREGFGMKLVGTD